VAGQPDAGRLLAAVAGALNALERAGITADLDHGAVLTARGYVLPAGDARLGSRWAVRMRTGLEPAGIPGRRSPSD
jgi:hypothetical protein